MSLQEAVDVLESQWQLDLPLNTFKVLIIIELAQGKSKEEDIIGHLFSFQCNIEKLIFTN